MKNWVVQYVYATDKDEKGVSIEHIEAETLEDAKEIAQKKAIAEEYIFNVLPQSEDQFLGTVRREAKILTGNGEIIESEEL